MSYEAQYYEETLKVKDLQQKLEKKENELHLAKSYIAELEGQLEGLQNYVDRLGEY